jgi:tRNA threonylcarbamoyl adenosine modification protein YeaZ
MLLAIDTSAGTSVAVVDPAGRALAERSSDDPRAHAEVIGTLLRETLAAASVGASDLTAVVAGMGPGPFTGLRVGIAAARAFAVGSGLPVLPVVSHDAIAFAHPGPVLVATDARRRELFVSRYAGSDETGLPVREEGPLVVARDHLVAPAGYAFVEAVTVSAAALGAVAALTRAAGRPFAADSAVYLRSPDVTLSAGPKRVSA